MVVNAPLHFSRFLELQMVVLNMRLELDLHLDMVLGVHMTCNVLMHADELVGYCGR